MSMAAASGTLYICATPIGNLEDITLRVIRVLREVHVIAAEDTRRTKKLLGHYDIKTPQISYHEHNRRARGEELLQRWARGENIALVSDAGMPGIADPAQSWARCHCCGHSGGSFTARRPLSLLWWCRACRLIVLSLPGFPPAGAGKGRIISVPWPPKGGLLFFMNPPTAW